MLMLTINSILKLLILIFFFLFLIDLEFYNLMTVITQL